MSHFDPVAFTGDADIWCPDCAQEKYGPDRQDGSRLDSEGNEVHAVFSGYESDTPDHCAGCGAFLENDLTPDGVRYVFESSLHNAVSREWHDFYGIPGGWENAPRQDDDPSDPDHSTVATYAWPGGYPLAYYIGEPDPDTGVVEPSDVFCPKCAQDVIDKPAEQSYGQSFAACEVNWEDTDVWCEGCYERIPCAYGDPDDEERSAAPAAVPPGQETLPLD